MLELLRKNLYNRQKRHHILLSFQNLFSFPQEIFKRGLRKGGIFSIIEFLNFAILPLLLQVFVFIYLYLKLL